MMRRAPRLTRADTLMPYTALCRAVLWRVRQTEVVVVAPFQCRGVQPQVIACAVISLERRESMVFLRSEEHTSALQSLMRTPYAVSCLKITQTTDDSRISNRRRSSLHSASHIPSLHYQNSTP